MSSLTRSKNGTFVIPGIFSAIIPGLGQLTKRHTTKALMFFAIYVLWILILGDFISWIPIVGWFKWLIGGFLWLVNVLDALFSTSTNSSR